MAELDSVCDELQRLIAQINHTNAATKLDTGATVTEGLAQRDILSPGKAACAPRCARQPQEGLHGLRYSRSEIRMVRQVSVGELQSQIDELAKQRRELDTTLQTHNWTTPLIE